MFLVDSWNMCFIVMGQKKEFHGQLLQAIKEIVNKEFTQRFFLIK